MSTPFADARSATLDVSWRPMREADLDAVALLESQSHAAPWSAGNFRDALAAGYSTIVGDAGGWSPPACLCPRPARRSF
jgi:hypothetical protein